MANTINGVNLERLAASERRVLEPVPTETREEFTYWRAAHLGSLALNLIQDLRHLNNSWGANFTHFWDDYSLAVNTAQELSSPGSLRQSQFGEAHATVLGQLAGLDRNFTYPAMILGLNPNFDSEVRKVDQELLTSQGDPGDIFSPRTLERPISYGGGYILDGRLTLDKIDRFSKMTILNFFELDN